MSDPFYLADILLGRVGVLRSTAESIVLELCEAQAKLDAQAGSEAGGADVSGLAAVAVGGGAGGSEDALRIAIKNKLERVQTNLKLLRKLVPEFGVWTARREGSSGENGCSFVVTMCVCYFLSLSLSLALDLSSADGKTKPIDNVNQTHR